MFDIVTLVGGWLSRSCCCVVVYVEETCSITVWLGWLLLLAGCGGFSQSTKRLYIE